MEIILISIYAICMLFIMVFSLVQLHLAFMYKKARNNKSEDVVQSNIKTEFPVVTIQLPLYNEKYV
ncbi:MAG: histidine kinase, partial [Cyclobacteriaceae bacterium]|nr:histidine kinase [Cyclobacteriaceae bacterium]